MAAPIAVQLYSVRKEAEADFVGVLERIAAIGYLGIEAAGLIANPRQEGPAPPFPDLLFDLREDDFRRRLDELELTLVGVVFAPPSLDADGGRFLDRQEAIGNSVLITSLEPGDFASVDARKRAAESVNRAAETARTRGMRFGYHNHWWEFAVAPDGERPIELFLEHLDPDVFLEVDLYWLQAAGLQPAETLATLGDRVGRVHVKDGPCTVPVISPNGLDGDPQTAVGTGKVNIAAALAAAPQVDWHVVELDSYSGDMFEAVEQSYRYLTERGFSIGRTAVRVEKGVER